MDSTELEAEKEIRELATELTKHNYDYHVLNDATISDSEFDVKLARLKALESKYPKYSSDRSPTKVVGGGVDNNWDTLKHPSRMYSLDNVFNAKELYDWGKGTGSDELVAEPKIDGLAVNLIYIGGRLQTAISRGDGVEGEIVIDNAMCVEGIPAILDDPKAPEYMEVRGEIHMPYKSFKAINEKLRSEGRKELSNVRNAAAGAMRLHKQHDRNEVRERGLYFLGYGLGIVRGGDSLSTYSESMELLDHLGFNIDLKNSSVVNVSLESLDLFIQDWMDKRKTLSYEIDGLVFKVDSIEKQKELGYTAKDPKWAIAYKFPATMKEAKVIDVIFQVGKSGIITPVAILDGVEIDGVVVTRATLHNVDEIERLDLRIGDIVNLSRRGDVIPKIEGVVLMEDFGDDLEPKPKVKFPKKCPSCKSKLIRKEGDIGYYCSSINDPEKFCKAIAVEKILHFTSRKAMNIKDFGPKLIGLLVDKGLVKTPSCLYRITYDMFMKLDGVSDVKAAKLREHLKESKDTQLHRFIFGLGIENVGLETAKALASTFGTLKTIQSASKEDLLKVNDIGDVVADSIVSYFSKPENDLLILRLINSSIVFKSETPKTQSGPLKGQRWVITGSFENETRDTLTEKLESQGAVVVNSVSSTTDCLLAGANAGSKLEKAKSLGILIKTSI